MALGSSFFLHDPHILPSFDFSEHDGTGVSKVIKMIKDIKRSSFTPLTLVIARHSYSPKLVSSMPNRFGGWPAQIRKALWGVILISWRKTRCMQITRPMEFSLCPVVMAKAECRNNNIGYGQQRLDVNEAIFLCQDTGTVFLPMTNMG